MNHNKIPQSLSLLTLHFGLAKSMSLQLTINLLYNRYWYYMAHLTELSSLDRAEDSWLSWWAKRLLLSWWANRFSMSLFHLWVSKGLLSLNHHYQMAQNLYWVGLLTAGWHSNGDRPSLAPQQVCTLHKDSAQKVLSLAQPQVCTRHNDSVQKVLSLAHNRYVHSTMAQCRRCWVWWVWLHNRYVQQQFGTT